MNNLKVIIFGLLMILIFSNVHANSLQNCSRIELRSGIWSSGSESGTVVSISGATINTSTNGALGILSYSKWYAEHLAVDISVGGLVAETELKVSGIIPGTSTQTTSITPILIGLKYYFPKSSFESSMRPFITAKLGTYIGHIVETETSLSVVINSRTEIAMGSFIGGGVDFRVSRKFMLGINMGYHALLDFPELIGDRKNYSGAEFSFGVSYLFGEK